ncbi:MAG: ThiF family adenylyltransferase [Pseudomonadota bacterium]
MMIQDLERYDKQMRFAGLGRAGQARLAAASVLVCGAGGLGGGLSQLLVRAGVGRVRVVDRDRVELTNLHRQLLYDEGDLGRPKAAAAAARLAAMNRAVAVEGLEAEVNAATIAELCAGVDLVLDGMDNLAARYVINDAAVGLGLPWVMAGCVAAHGNVMLIEPGRTPCLRCLFPEPPAEGSFPTSDSAGILGPTAAAVAAIAALEALKWLAGARAAVNQGMLYLNLWDGSFNLVRMGQGPHPGCICNPAKT